MVRKIIPGTYNLYVSDVCEFTYPDGEECKLPINDEGIVEITLYGNKYNLHKQFLMLYAWFEMPSFININHLYFIPLNIRRKHFPWRAMLHEPYYYDYNKKLRLVPSFSTIAVSITGECYNTNSCKFLNKYIGKTGYEFINIYDPLMQKYRHIQVHTLVASAWVINNQNSENFVVNHIDGNKLNNNANNLEWCTLGHNARDGKRRMIDKRDYFIGKVRNIYTNEIMQFKTFSELGKFLNIKTVCSSTYFKGMRINHLFNDKYEVRLIDDNRPWFYTEENKNKNKSNYIISVEEPDGDIVTLNGIKSFTDYYNLPKGKTSINDKIKIFKERFPGFKINYCNLKLAQEIEVMLIDGSIKTFKSRKDAAEYLHVSWNTINRLVIHNGTKSINGIRARTKCSDPWPEEVKDSYTTNVIIKIIDKFTNKEYLYSSIKSVAYDFNMTTRLVSRHISKPHPNDRLLVTILGNDQSP